MTLKFKWFLFYEGIFGVWGTLACSQCMCINLGLNVVFKLVLKLYCMAGHYICNKTFFV